MEVVLDMRQVMGISIYSSDVEDITRLGRHEPGANQPPPVRFQFQFQYMIDNILQKKSNLLKKPKFAAVFINTDEPIEMIRIKGIVTHIATKAREDGKIVTYHSDWIKIDKEIYHVTDMEKIPDKYMSDAVRKPRSDTPHHMAAATAMDSPDSNANKAEDKLKAANLLMDPNMTKSSLPFSGKAAFVSNHSIIYL